MNSTHKKAKLTNKLTPYFLVAPAIIGMILFVIYPIIYMSRLSLNSWNLISPTMEFIGLDNYVNFFTSETALSVLSNTMLYTVLLVVGTLLISILLAVWFNHSAKFERFGQLAIFTPHIISYVSVSLVWMWLMEPDYGLLNLVLSFFNIPPVKWLDSPKTALISLVIVTIWKTVGYYLITIIAGIHNIDKSILEAAKIDSTSRTRVFFRITLPLLSPTLFFLLIICTISSFKVFDIIQIMTGGGPVGSTNMLVYYIYDNAFRFLKIGYASAAGVILVVIVGVMTIIYFKVLSNKVHYQ